MRSRRLALTLLIVGSLGVLGSCALQWVSATISVLSGVGTRSFTATGSEVLPQATAWAVLALAGCLAYIALRGWVRQVVGFIVVSCGVVLAVQAIGFALNPVIDGGGETLIDVQVRPWWLVVTVCSALIVLAGLAGGLWSRPWPSLGARYEAGGSRRQRPSSPGDSLDAGQDPTTSDPEATQSPA